MAQNISAPGTISPSFRPPLSLVLMFFFQWTEKKVNALGVCLTPVYGAAGVANSSLVWVVRLFLSAVAWNNPSRQNKAARSGTLT